MSQQKALAPRPLPGPRFLNPITFMRSLSDPTGLMLKTQRQYGDTYRLPTIFGPVVVIGHPDGVRAIFRADPDSFVPYQTESSAVFLGETSLINVAGMRHRRDRKLLLPPFHGARMRAYGTIMASCAERVAASWKEGTRFNMLDVAQDISLEVILRAVFGVDHASAQGKEVREAVVRYVGSIRPSFLFMRWMRRDFFGLSAWARFKRARNHLDTLLYAQMAERRREQAEHDDILSLMMSARHEDGSAMSDRELRDELLTLLFAGHETTAIALTWAFYWLHQNMDELQQVLDEIDTLGSSPEPEAIVALPYLDAVCQEALRIHPVAPEIPRVLVKPLQLDDRALPAGTAVMVSVILLHNRQELYPEPTQFRPSRFIERKFTPFEYIPFGGGARRCIGAAFALYEMKIVLATLLRAHRLQRVGSAPVRPVRRGFTMGPKGGLPMICQGPRTVAR